MDFLTLAEMRYSARSFTDQMVEPEKVQTILRAGQLAPTAINFQPHRVLVVQGEEQLAKLGEADYHVGRFHPAVCFVVCYDQKAAGNRPFDNHSYGLTDAVIVATHMMLQITELGLGSTWVGHFPPDKVKAALNLPESWVPVAILETGYPAEDCKPADNHFRRKEIGEFAFINDLDHPADQQAIV